MKFAILSMVKNEADIIESFVRHNLQFADEMFILDNGSDDQTFLILQKLKEEGLPIHLYQDYTLGHQQQQISASLLAKAQNKSDADIFMLLDADEFICIHPQAPIYGQKEHYQTFFQSHLQQVGRLGVAALKWLNFLPIDTNGSCDYINFFHEYSECKTPPIAHQKAIYSREMLANADTVAGNHHLKNKQTGEHIEQTVFEHIALAHFPIRSEEQAVAKILTNAISLSSRHLKEGESFHIFQMQREIESDHYRLSMEKCREIAQNYGIPSFYTQGTNNRKGKINPSPIRHQYLHLNNLSLTRSLARIAGNFSQNTKILKKTISALQQENQELNHINHSLQANIMSFEQQNQQFQTLLTQILQQIEQNGRKTDLLQEQIDTLLLTHKEAEHAKQQFETTRQELDSARQQIHDLQLQIDTLTHERNVLAQSMQLSTQSQNDLEAHLQRNIYSFSKYKNLWTVRLLKPLIKIEQAISSGNRYRKLFRDLIKQKGSIGKAYQACRRTYKAYGFRATKALLRQQNLDIQTIQALEIESAKEGFVILATKHTRYIAQLFVNALQKVGIDSSVIFETPQNGYSSKWHIVVCPQMFETLPANYLAFQMEQSVSSRWFTEAYFQRLRQAAHVFDYSIANIDFLQKHQLPFKQLHYMPVGVLPLHSYQPDDEFEYDVAFYGDPNCDRRRLFLEKLQEKFSVKVISEVFGDELHNLLKKAKIVVNIHYYENALLETTRIYECLSLNKLVVSEKGSDQAEHTELEDMVDFVEIDDSEAMIERIAYWLNSPEAFDTRLKAIADFQQQPDKFQFYLYRFLLSQDLIDFETFYRLSSGYTKPKGDFWCLSLPESVARRQDFDRDNRYGIDVFPGLRHNIGWVGCGLSYKFMMRLAEDLNLPHVTICEDDVLFNQNFEKRYESIKQTLTHTDKDWDVYSGLIADLSEKTEISNSDITNSDERFYNINRLVSMVFNIYNQSAYAKIYTWDENDRLFHNTVDRYIEQHGGIQGVITSPFLVGHKEDLCSTLWGQQNTIYRDMIAKSQNLLEQKIADLNNQP